MTYKITLNEMLLVNKADVLAAAAVTIDDVAEIRSIFIVRTDNGPIMKMPSAQYFIEGFPGQAAYVRLLDKELEAAIHKTVLGAYHEMTKPQADKQKRAH